MSYNKSLPLTLDLTPPWLCLAAAAAWLAFVVFAATVSAAPVWLKLLVAGAAVAGGAGVLATQMFGVLRGALRRAVLRPGGEWRLIDGYGVETTARLAADSRCSLGCAWLKWTGPAGEARWALIVGQARNQVALRRLRQELRLG